MLRLRDKLRPKSSSMKHFPRSMHGVNDVILWCNQADVCYLRYVVRSLMIFACLQTRHTHLGWKNFWIWLAEKRFKLKSTWTNIYPASSHSAHDTSNEQKNSKQSLKSIYTTHIVLILHKNSITFGIALESSNEKSCIRRVWRFSANSNRSLRTRAVSLWVCQFTDVFLFDAYF